MSSVAQIDQNDKPSWLAYNETTGAVETVTCDPITNALYVFGVTASGNVPTTLNTAKIDENEKATELGYNETAETVEALRCGSSGELIAIIVT